MVVSAAIALFAMVAAPSIAHSQQFCNNGSSGGSKSIYPYLFNNNTFGYNQDTGGYECYTVSYTNSANNGVYYDGFTSNWNWPTNSNQYSVKAYPSMVYGWQYGYAFSGLGLPAIIYNNKNIPTYQSFNFTGSQNEDVLIDNWILNSPNASAQSDEVEIFVSNDIGACCSGNNLGTQTVDNTYYYVSSRAPYANGGSNSWYVYNFIPNQGSTNFSQSLNVKDFVNVLTYDYGVLNNNQYVGGTQIGVEVYHGSGSVTYNPAAISVN